MGQSWVSFSSISKPINLFFKCSLLQDSFVIVTVREGADAIICNRQAKMGLL